MAKRGQRETLGFGWLVYLLCFMLSLISKRKESQCGASPAIVIDKILGWTRFVLLKRKTQRSSHIFLNFETL